MPIKITKIKNKNLYKVSDNEGKIYSKGTTKIKAEKQRKLLEYVLK